MSMLRSSRHRLTQLLGGDECRRKPPVTSPGKPKTPEPVVPEPPVVARKKADVPDGDHERHKLEPERLDQDMTPDDLIFVLKYLHFGSKGAFSLIQIDRGVRDFLIRAVSSCHATRPDR
jgi:hypothetical protein